MATYKEQLTMEFSDVIKEVRKRTGLSQQKLADKLGLSYPTINRWERSHFDPSPRISSIVSDYIRKLGEGYTDLLVNFKDVKLQPILTL